MKRMYLFLMMCAMALATYMVAFAQNTNVVLDPSQMPAPGSDWRVWVGWACTIGILVVWEIVARYVPTVRNWAWTSWIFKGIAFVPKIIDALMPNKKTDGGEHKTIQ